MPPASVVIEVGSDLGEAVELRDRADDFDVRAEREGPKSVVRVEDVDAAGGVLDVVLDAGAAAEVDRRDDAADLDDLAEAVGDGVGRRGVDLGLGDRVERRRVDEERRVRAGGAQLRVGGGDGELFAPGVVAGATVALKEKTLSPPVTSPFEPSSKSVCEALPPMRVRSAVTVMPVLVGPVPGVTWR